MRIELAPIGVIHTPFLEPPGTPIQPVYAAAVEGSIELFEPFLPGLADLEGFGRIWLLYWCDRVPAARMRVIPYRDTREHGVFATRAPARPNPIGISCVELLRVEGAVVHVRGVDILEGTPLLDIKPYVAEFDSFPGAASGWFSESSTGRTMADNRFHERANSPTKENTR